MPAKHTVFCKAAAAVKRLPSKQHGVSAFDQKIIDAIVAQQACLEAINSRLHRLEVASHAVDPNRPLG